MLCMKEMPRFVRKTLQRSMICLTILVEEVAKELGENEISWARRTVLFYNKDTTYKEVDEKSRELSMHSSKR